jgi:endonuclease I
MRKLLCIFMLGTTIVSLAQIPSGYYDAANGQSGTALKTTLNNIIDGHTELSYDACWDALKVTDRDPNNSANVIGIYSRFSMNAALEYDAAQGWNREHVWAKSRGDFGTTLGAGTDLHHLRAEDVSTNSARNNRAFDEGGSTYVDGSGNYQGTTPAKSGSVDFTWYPGDEVKGDIARMIFYMATRYEGENGEVDLELTDAVLANTDKQPLHGRISVLLLWHQQDPVSAEEINRHEAIYSFQNNRNPFIDHPEYVSSIWGGTAPTAPSFTSSAPTTATAATAYNYSITTTGSGTLTLSAPTLPAWLSFTNGGDGSGSISGTPASMDVGSHAVVLEVTDGTDITSQSFSVNVSPAGGGGTGSATELLFSEYMEGSSYNKAVEIANFTGASMSLSGYELKKQTNGAGDWSGGIALSGTISDGDVYVLAHSSAGSTVLAQADYSGSSTELNFNGNDALGLFKNGAFIDVIGVFGSTATFGANVTLVRNADITSPNLNYTTSEWTSNASDDFSDLGTHTMNVAPPNQAPSINITSPTSGSTVTTGSSVTVVASASDTDGTITSVEFFVNGSSIGTDTSSPYQASFTASTGGMALTAIATDDGTASTTSASISINGEVPPPTGVLYFSEYIEGSSNNKALEIANTSGSSENLSGYVVKKQTNGVGAWSTGISLSGTLANGSVYVLANSSANADILGKADFTGGNAELTFNGNDAVGLFKDGTLVDIIGIFNSATTFAQDVTMRRNDNINSPNDSYATSEWTDFAPDNSAGLGLRIGESTPNVAPSVSISSPTSSSVFTDGDVVAITASASDSDGSISNVEFFVDGVSLGTDSNSPYSINWTIGVGTYSLTATATDNEAASTGSSSVSITGEAASSGETVLSYDDFESGWGNFTDGGKDAYYSSDASKAYAGSGSAGIQDNTSSSVITYGSSVDITSYSQVRIDFYFLPVSMENNEDFWLQIYNGSSYVTVASYAAGTDFYNNNFYVSSITIDPTDVNFASNMKVRFRCDASGNSDDVYIDEVTVTGISGNGARLEKSTKTVGSIREANIILEEEFDFELIIFLNPIKDILNASFGLDNSANGVVELLDVSGKMVVSQSQAFAKGKNDIFIETSSLKSGIYFLKVMTNEEVQIKRVIKN